MAITGQEPQTLGLIKSELYYSSFLGLYSSPPLFSSPSLTMQMTKTAREILHWSPIPSAEFLVLRWIGCPCCQGYRLSTMMETELLQMVKRLRSAKWDPLPGLYNPLPGAYSHKCPKSNGIPSVSWVLWQNRSHISFCILRIQFCRQLQRQLPLEEQLWVTTVNLSTVGGLLICSQTMLVCAQWLFEMVRKDAFRHFCIF